MVDKQGIDGELRELALFAGAGGGVLGGKLLGWRTVCAVEIEPYPASVLCARQNDGLLPPFPIWDDVCTFDGRPWRGIVDVVSGGFPCQDLSCAGKGAGITGARSGLWKEFARIIGEVRPRFAFVENSPMLTSRGLGTVLGDLAALGYDAEWGVVSAENAGAPHQRERIWILAYSDSNGRATGSVTGGIGETKEQQQAGENHPQHLAGTGSIATTSEKLAYTMRQGSPPERDESGEQGGFGKCGKNVADTMPARERREPRENETEGNAFHRHPDEINEQEKREICGGENAVTSGVCREIRYTSIAGLPDWAGGEVGQPCPVSEFERPSAENVSDAEMLHVERQPNGQGEREFRGSSRREIERDFCGVAHGVVARVDRLKALGNGQVPQCAALAWTILRSRTGQP